MGIGDTGNLRLEDRDLRYQKSEIRELGLEMRRNRKYYDYNK